MRKIVAGLFISLDGVVEAPGTWNAPYFNDEMADAMRAGIEHADAVLLGRRTYEQFAAFWPGQGNDSPLAGFLNNAPKYVVSATLGTLPWANSSRIAGDLTGELTKLKQQPGKNIQIPGSPTLVRSLLRDELLDELNLFVFPVVVGTGMRLFADLADQLRFKLVESRPFSTGALSLKYQPAI